MIVALRPSRYVQDPEVLWRAMGLREWSDRRRGSVRVAAPVGPGIGREQADSGSQGSSTRGCGGSRVLRALRGCGDETSELPRLRPRVDRQQSASIRITNFGDLK